MGKVLQAITGSTKRIVGIMAHDFQRVFTNPVAAIIAVGVMVLPSLYAWFNIQASWDPYGSTDNISVAVSNVDEGTVVQGMELNVGKSIVESLAENEQIGWKFVNKEKALAGVRSGKYYAAVVIPEDFSKNMTSVLTPDIERPKIEYYVNEKKNAIAPKITSKAKTAVQEQVNATFVSTLAEVMLKVNDVMVENGMDSGSMINLFLTQLNDLSGDLDGYIALLNSFVSITNSASSLIDTTQVMLPNLNTMVDDGSNTVNTMQGALNSGSLNASALAEVISANLNTAADSLDNINTLIQNALDQLDNYGDLSSGGLQSAINMMPLIRQLFENSVADWKDDESVSGQIAEIEAQLDKIEADLNSVQNNVTDLNTAKDTLNTEISTEITSCKTKIKALKDTFDYSVKGQLETTIQSMQGSLNQTQAILNGVNGDFDEVSEVLDAYSETLDKGNESLRDSLAAAQEMKTGLDSVITSLSALEISDQYQALMKILETDPTLLGDFLSSPVNMETKEIYPISNYGSAMSPFYTVLALWVGALILVAIIHVKVLPDEKIPDAKPYQKFFGRYITFFLIGQVQALITALGDLFYIKIQCHNPFLFWLACACCSFVFTLFMYALTVAFENVGEALAVVIMVIQVAGAGGSFPIEVLPAIYQRIYRFFPFPYAIDAMRECICGLYGDYYIRQLAFLLLFVAAALLIGLLVRRPFMGLNRFMEEKLEETELL